MKKQRNSKELNIDFIQSPDLTKEEANALDEFIKMRKEISRKKTRSLKKGLPKKSNLTKSQA